MPINFPMCDTVDQRLSVGKEYDYFFIADTKYTVRMPIGKLDGLLKSLLTLNEKLNEGNATEMHEMSKPKRIKRKKLP